MGLGGLVALCLVFSLTTRNIESGFGLDHLCIRQQETFKEGDTSSILVPVFMVEHNASLFAATHEAAYYQLWKRSREGDQRLFSILAETLSISAPHGFEAPGKQHPMIRIDLSIRGRDWIEGKSRSALCALTTETDDLTLAFRRYLSKDLHTGGLVVGRETLRLWWKECLNPSTNYAPAYATCILAFDLLAMRYAWMKCIGIKSHLQSTEYMPSIRRRRLTLWKFLGENLQGLTTWRDLDRPMYCPDVLASFREGDT